MKILLFVTMVVASRCGPEPVEPSPSVDTDTEVVPEPIDTGEEPTACEMACDNIRLIGCAGADGSPGPDEQFGTGDDVSCADVCEDIMSKGDFSIEPECVSAARACEDVDSCFKVANSSSR